MEPGGGLAYSMPLYEKDVVLDICLSAAYSLQMKHDVALSRYQDVFTDLPERVALSHACKADIFVSVHCNADPDLDKPGMSEGQGEEIWVYPGSRAAYCLAMDLQARIDNFFPEHKFRGIKETDAFYVLRKTRMPAVLLECGFIDCKREAQTFASPEKRNFFGAVLANGITEYIYKKEKI